MKNLVLAVSLLFVSSLAVASPYINGQAGLSTPSDGATLGSVAEVRGGVKRGNWDWSAGYIRNDSKNLVIHTPNIELYRHFSLLGMDARLGAGMGYSILNTDGPESFDNGLSGLFGGGLSHNLTENLSLGLNIRYFVFNTDSHSRGTSVENTTLFIDGVPSGEVETATETHSYNSVNFNSALITLAVTYHF